MIEQVEKIFEKSVDFSRQIDDAGIMYLIEKALNKVCETKYVPLEERKEIVRYIFNKRRRYGILEPLIQDEDINEIMVNGENDIFYEKEGRICRYEGSFDSKETLLRIIRNMMLVANRTINEKNPIADARLSNGERICAVLDNVAINGPILAIRKFCKRCMGIDDLIANGTLDPDMAAFISEIVGKRYNIIISGGTSSGKTTFLNILSDFIGSGERVVTIEDSLELNLKHVDNIIKLEIKEEPLMIDAKKLVKTALRLRPDRIIVGEVRGKEAFYMLQAMNTGHDGSMSTGHANSSRDMLSRLEGMVSSEFDIPVMSVRNYISSAIDILIHLKKTVNGRRVVKEIIQLTGATEDGYAAQTLFEYTEGVFHKRDELVPKGGRPEHSIRDTVRCAVL